MAKIINPILLNHTNTSPRPTKNNPQALGAFNSVFKQELANITISKHAQQRIENRGIPIDEPTLGKISEAMDKLSQKGGKDSLVFIDEVAYIVNPQKKIIITAVDKSNLQENVFTGIDSAIFI